MNHSVTPKKQASRLPTPAQLKKWDCRYVWHPFTQMQEWPTEPPLIIDRAKGVYLFDQQGRKYLDGISSMWVNIHGHRHPVIDRAIRRQLRRVAHSTLLGLANPPSILLAKELIRLAPPGLTKVFFSDNGSTAVEIALKMAVQYWQQHNPAAGTKHTFVRLEAAYHGDTVGSMSVSGVELFQQRFRPLLFPCLSVPAPYCYRCPIGLTYPRCDLACVSPLEQVLAKRHSDIAGVIIEPMVQAVAGMITQPPGYLRRIREVCTHYNVLLIADEVATGFGRTGKMFACDHERVSPDLMVLAKGLTGGYLPLAATLATERIYEAFLGKYEEFKTFFHGHSYTGNALACAAALANLELFRVERTLTRVQMHAKRLARLLDPLRQYPCVGEIRQCGLMVGIELVQDHVTRTPLPLTARVGQRVARAARARGLIIRPIGNVVLLVPPLITTSGQLQQMVSILSESIQIVSSQIQ
ncbi:MAG: adenosylmethionine--8-amino-7-oxononanoate transaminase [Nitrospirae bacterium]|nr:MAG: adenosylmethionine--8-amino-7-oxononanoate transaminase [Nitrospirota bacterium]